MSDIPYSGTDPIVTKINKMMRSAVTGVVVRMIEAKVIAVQPWMAFPGWKQLWQYFFEYIMSESYEELSEWLIGEYTDAQVAEQVRVAKEAKAKLAKEMSKPKEEQDIDKILEDFDKAFERAIRFPRPSK